MPSASSRAHTVIASPPSAVRPMYGAVTIPTVASAKHCITRVRYCGDTRISLSLISTCSYRASRSICTRLLTLPDVPSRSRHSTSRIAHSGNSARSRSISPTAGSSRLLTPKTISNLPAYCCWQWLTNPAYMRSSTPFTGFRIVTSGANPASTLLPLPIVHKIPRAPQRQQHVSNPASVNRAS